MFLLMGSSLLSQGNIKNMLGLWGGGGDLPSEISGMNRKIVNNLFYESNTG